MAILHFYSSVKKALAFFSFVQQNMIVNKYPPSFVIAQNNFENIFEKVEKIKSRSPSYRNKV
jgi:hypothetical protein